MKTFQKGVRRFCSVIIGIVFLIAGMLKLMDPVGAGLVVDEYLKFFHFGWLAPASKAIGVMMALAEALIGAALLAGVWRKVVAWITTAFMAFFTVLTLILLIANPQMDCGCFGEAIHLSHLGTFLKNVVLCALCAIAFIPQKEKDVTKKRKVVAFVPIAVLVIVFCCYSLRHLPLIDYTEFAPGASLVEDEDDEVVADGMKVNADKDVKQEMYVIYEKDGKEGAFTLDKLPDSTWTFVRVQEIEHAIADYQQSAPYIFLSDAYGEYQNEVLLSGNVMVLSIYDNERFSSKDIEEAQSFMEDARAAGFRAIAISRAMVQELQPDAYTSDFKKIITMNRSNGGVTWISDGEIIRKWTAADRPDSAELNKLATVNSIEYMTKGTSKGRIAFQGMILYSLALLLLI